MFFMLHELFDRIPLMRLFFTLWDPINMFFISSFSPTMFASLLSTFSMLLNLSSRTSVALLKIGFGFLTNSVFDPHHNSFLFLIIVKINFKNIIHLLSNYNIKVSLFIFFWNTFYYFVFIILFFFHFLFLFSMNLIQHRIWWNCLQFGLRGNLLLDRW